MWRYLKDRHLCRQARRWLTIGLMVVGAAGIAAPVFAAKHVAPPKLNTLYAAYSQGEQAYAAGDWDTARDRYLDITKLDAGQAPAWLRLGVIQHRTGHWRESLGAYDQVLTLYAATPEAPEAAELVAKARYDRALLFLSAAKDDLAAVEGSPLDPALLRSRAVIAVRVDDALRASSPDAANEMAAAPAVIERAAPAVVIGRSSAGTKPIRIIRGGMHAADTSGVQP